MPGFNPFRYRFPYTNINDINLDWIIKKVKALSDAVASIDVSRMDEIAQQAETAQQDAETALATAQSAETTANSVQGIANNALTTAQSAETTAQSAETTANSVQGIANNALTTAQSAETTAQSAETTANSVQGIANNALTTANNAISGVNALNASKADKVRDATLGNFASLATNGNLLDSGHSNSDYAPAAAAIPVGGAFGEVLTKIGSADYAAAWQSPSGGGGDVTADMLGIVINGNSTPAGAAVGQYVIVKNSTISGITDGLYTAAQAIPANTAIDSTYLTAVGGGGLNDLKNSFTANSSETVTLSSGGLVSFKKCGNIVVAMFSGNGHAQTQVQTDSNKIPSAYAVPFNLTQVVTNPGNLGYFVLQTNGSIGYLNNDRWASGTITYCV